MLSTIRPGLLASARWGQLGAAARASLVPGKRFENTIAVDRGGLLGNQSKRDVPNYEELLDRPLTPMEEYLVTRISMHGPITVGEFMREALTNPKYGYYTCQKHVFGQQGDFVTAPEISQMFGELLGVWMVSAWQQLGKPKDINIVELGPGRGTLMRDFLRTSRQFQGFWNALKSVQLVEVSPERRLEQYSAVVSQETPSEIECHPKQYDLQYLSPAKISWHDSLSNLRECPTLLIAQEFLDALPIHQFIWSSEKKQWCEKMVDLRTEPAADGEEGASTPFRYVLTPTTTPLGRIFLSEENCQVVRAADYGMDPERYKDFAKLAAEYDGQVEICPGAVSAIDVVAGHIAKHSGAALWIDYGEPFALADSLRGIRNHVQFNDILQHAGESDITGYVDFGTLAGAIKTSPHSERLRVLPILSQGDFLLEMGIGTRLASLMRTAADEEARKAIKEGAERLINADQMGSSYKVFGFVSSDCGSMYPFEDE